MVRIISILRMRQLLLIELSKLQQLQQLRLLFTGAGAPSTISFSFFQAKTSCFTNNFDYVDFRCASIFQDYVEGIFSSAAFSTTSSCYGYRRAAAVTPNSSSIAFTRSLSSRIILLLSIQQRCFQCSMPFRFPP